MNKIVPVAVALAAVTAFAQEAVVIEPTRPAHRVTVHVEEYAADPVEAVLIVQNHASDDFQKPLSNLGDQLSQALSGDIFNIIDPNDAIGDEQNRGPWGEKMPVSAATRLAENLDAQALLTAAVGETSVIGFGTPAKVQAIRMSLTLSAKRIPKGATIASVTVTETSANMLPAELEQNSEAVYSELVRSLVSKASSAFLVKCKGVDWDKNRVRLVEVAFGCNFPGADVSIDGVSYGTAGTIGQAPLRVKVSDGLHNLKISYPYTEPYEVRAKLQEGTTFIAVLRLTEEGRRIRKEDEYFDLLMDRIEKSGATDDQVRMIRAKGYGKYLSSSYTRIKGMPKFLSMRDCEMPDFGLNPDKEGDGVQTSTKDLFEQAGAAAGIQMPGKDADAADVVDSNGKNADSEQVGNAAGAVDGKGTNNQNVPQPTVGGDPTQSRQQTVPIQQAVPAQQQGAVVPASASSPTGQPRNEVLQGLSDIREGVNTSKDIVQGIKDIGDILK